jgi:hypothetical protein
MKRYEKLGAFYLGKIVEPQKRTLTAETLLYDAKDLTTHAVCVGMTGSGKTGLCVTMLEEAGIDGIPVIAIDPKGDLGNMLLTFPELQPSDFSPWIDEAEALRKGSAPSEYARKVAGLWRNGLAEWDQEPSRIGKFRDSVDLAIYTPGSKAGIPLSVLRSFRAPEAALLSDDEALSERIGAAVSGLLSLLGIQADPLRSREHILLANILQGAWLEGRSLDIPSLIREIQSPPFRSIGILDLDSFFPPKDRIDLAMMLNNLLASPGFGIWMEGDPLDIQNLLYTGTGKPRISILSIAHLSDAQRMFFVTVLLNEIIAWMRSQPGTTSLRAILYMDEVFGYFPPTAMPPSKKPMLTLLKQARAFGLGCVLATQNPVDLDYKGLSNAGTWFLGRLQTERDLARVLDGLEGASTAGGAQFDRAGVERMIAGLKSRVFLMNNVHEDEPVLFHTRWALSYLRGPLTRTQIQELMAGRAKPDRPQPDSAAAVRTPREAVQDTTVQKRPVLSPNIKELFLQISGNLGRNDRILYRPSLLGRARLHYVSARSGIDIWREELLKAPLVEDTVDPWHEADLLVGDEVTLESKGDDRADFASLPHQSLSAKQFSGWSKDLRNHLYRTHAISIWKCPQLREASHAGETEGAFRARLAQVAREKRDLEVEKLRKRYAPKLVRLQERIRRAEQTVEQQESQYRDQKVQSAISIGATLLGALLGRKASTIGRATTAARRMGRTAREKGDVQRAMETAESLRQKLNDLEQEFESEVEDLRDSFDVEALDLKETRVRPRKSDIEVTELALLWSPWRVDQDGFAEPIHQS